VPEACLLAGTALHLARRLVDDLQVHIDAMESNLAATRGYWGSEQVLVALGPKLGKHHAQALLHEAMRQGWREGGTLVEAVARHPELSGSFEEGELERLTAAPGLGSAGVMVDTVVERARRARSGEPEVWQ
jgi:adenylosuccinate lyase